MRRTLLSVADVLFLWTAVALAGNPVKVIVFPLSGPFKSGALAWLGDGIAASISDQLAGGSVKVMGQEERIELVESLDLPPGAQLSRGSMIRVAQRASADLVVMGTCSGTEQNLKISVRVLDLNGLKLSGEMSANGPFVVLPQLENELAWLILANTGLEKAPSREKFQERIRRVPNSSYACYIESLRASSESDQLHLLLKALSGYRDFPEAQFRVGRLYFLKGDCGSAIPHLMQGRGESRAGLEGEFMRGTCYVQGGQALEAIQAFSQILQNCRTPEVLNNLGVAYIRKGDTTLALNALLEAKNLAHADSTISLNLAIVRYLQGNSAVARSVLEDAVKAYPKNGMLQFLLGFLFKSQGEGEKAAMAMDKAGKYGINVEKLEQEDPKTWSRVLLTWKPCIAPLQSW